jgi:glycosyltransferase involved in cell wall biosynthesis
MVCQEPRRWTTGGRVADFLILEPRRINLNGHYLSYIVEIGREAARRGGSLGLITHRGVERAALEKLAATQVAVELRYRRLPMFLHQDRRRWISDNVQSALVVGGALRKAGPETIVFALSADWTYLLGLEAATRCFPPRHPLIVQFFDAGRLEKGFASPSRRGRLRRATRGALQRMERRGVLRLCAQGKPVAAELSRLLDLPVAAAPMMVPWRDAERVPPGDPPRVAFVGEIREEKGFAQFVEALFLVKGRHQLDALVTRVARHMSSAAFEEKLRPLRSHPRATLRTQSVSPREYLSLVARADVVALPYAPKVYGLKSSNIFTEALGLETVPVIPRATWMGELVERLDVGVAYAPYDAGGLARGIDTALQRLPQLQARLRVLAPEWRALNDVGRLVDFLEELAGFPEQTAPVGPRSGS